MDGEIRNHYVVTAHTAEAAVWYIAEGKVSTDPQDRRLAATYLDVASFKDQQMAERTAAALNADAGW